MLCFAIGNAFAWRDILLAAGKALVWVKNVTDFLTFCYLNIGCLRINITLIFMSSSSDEFMHLKKNSKTDVSVGFKRPYLSPVKGHQHGISIQIYINLGKTFFPNFSHTRSHTDLILGQAFCIFIFVHFPCSGFSVLNGSPGLSWRAGDQGFPPATRSVAPSYFCNFVTLFDLPQNTNNDKTRQLHKSKWKWRGSPKRNHEAYRNWAPSE